MNKISLYIFLIIVFLGVSANYSPTERGIPYIINEKVFSNYFGGAPITLILVDSFQTGFLIKSYYQVYIKFHGFRPSEKRIVKTSYTFWNKNLNNHGMSLFSREERLNEINTTPLPPGAIFIGDLAYGYWEYADSGIKKWVFHRAYRDFPERFGWKNFVPTYDFYQKMQIFKDSGSPFYGTNNEFGTNGSVTKNFLFRPSSDSPIQIGKIKLLVRRLFSTRHWKPNE